MHSANSATEHTTITWPLVTNAMFEVSGELPDEAPLALVGNSRRKAGKL
jgi:hypothetical protein